jgi:hypothetical protein
MAYDMLCLIDLSKFAEAIQALSGQQPVAGGAA